MHGAMRDGSVAFWDYGCNGIFYESHITWMLKFSCIILMKFKTLISSLNRNRNKH